MGDFHDLVYQFITAASLSMPRALVALLLVPIFSLKVLRGLARTAVVLGVTLPVIGSVFYQLPSEPLGPINFILLALKEAAIGFILGFLLALPFWLFQSVGSMIDNQRGALAGGYFNPGAGPDSSILGELLTKSLAMLMIQSGAFVALFSVLIQSYVLWPPLDMVLQFNDSGYEFLIEKTQAMLYKFVLYAGPIIIVLLLVESVFAILGAYTPQLQVYFISMPAKSLVGLLVLVFYFSTLWYLGESELFEYYDLRDSLPLLFGNGEQQ